MPIIHHRLSKAVLFLASMTCVLLQLGCTPSTAPMSDAGRAKELLQSALDAWQSGASIEDSRKANPPVYVTEDFWRNGSKLREYKLVGESEVLGSNIRFKVDLRCTNKAGKAMDKSVRYLVTTVPALTIVREEG